MRAFLSNNSVRLFCLATCCQVALEHNALAATGSQPTASAGTPSAAEVRFVEASDFTFAMKGRVLAGRAAGQFVQLLNHFGLQHQITTWIADNEAPIREILRKTGLPGALIYVEVQNSNTDVSIKTLVGDKPYVVGPGLTQVDVWKAHALGPNEDLKPHVSPGFRSNQEDSFFVWAEPDGVRVKFGYTYPAPFILNEARRMVSDENLEKLFRDDYDYRLATFLIAKVASDSSVDKTLQAQARSLVEQRRAALEERKRIDSDLHEALVKAAHAQQVAVVFDTISKVLTVAKLALNLAAEFPDQSDKLSKATTRSEIADIFQKISREADQNADEMNLKYKDYQDRMRNLRLETLTVIKARKIDDTLRALYGNSVLGGLDVVGEGGFTPIFYSRKLASAVLASKGGLKQNPVLD